MLTRREGLALAALTAAAGALRAFDLGRFELWVDEAASAWLARLAAAGDFGAQMGSEPSPPLYYLLLGAWTRLFGEGDLALRLPSVAAGTLTVPAAYLLARRLFSSGDRDRWVAWLAAALVAVHPLHVFYSREARVYPLLLLVAVVALERLARALELPSSEGGLPMPERGSADRARSATRPSGREALEHGAQGADPYVPRALPTLERGSADRARSATRPSGREAFEHRAETADPRSFTSSPWMTVAALFAAACYLHLYGLFLLAAGGLIVLFLAPSPAVRWRGLAALGLAGFAFAPYLWAVLPHLGASGIGWWVEEVGLGRALEPLFVGAGVDPQLRHLARPPTPALLRWPALAAQALLLAVAAASARRPGRGRAIAFLALAWLVPILLPWAVSHLGRPIHLPGRHALHALGALAVLLAAGLAELLGGGQVFQRRWPRRALAAGVLLALGAGVAYRLAWLHLAPAGERHRPAATLLAERAAPGDRVIATGLRRLVTEHYLRLAGGALEVTSWPPSTDRHPGWSDLPAQLREPERLRREAAELAAALERGWQPGATLWLLYRPYQRAGGERTTSWVVDAPLYAALEERGFRRAQHLEGEKMKQLEIALYRRPPAEPGEPP